MAIVRVIYIFMMGLIYGIFTKGTTTDEYSISHIFGVSIGFMVISFVFAAIVYFISMIFIVNKTIETEQENNIILDSEYTAPTQQTLTNFERFTKYWLIVGIVILGIMALNTVI